MTMPKDKLLILEETVKNWLADRPIMDAHNTPHAVLLLLKGELEEFESAILENGDEAIADKKLDVEQEFADLVIFLLTLSAKLGIDVFAVTMEKMAFNLARYNAVFFQEGDYLEARKKVKKIEKENKMKEEFYAD